MVKNISSIIINAPIQKVWDTVTQPALVKQWQFGSDLITDWKIGSEIRFRSEWNNQIFEQWGIVKDIRLHEYIQYSLFAPGSGREDIPENYFTMHYNFSSENGGTKLVIIQEDNRSGAVQEAPQGEENPVLSSLKAVAEAAD